MRWVHKVLGHRQWVGESKLFRFCSCGKFWELWEL